MVVKFWPFNLYQMPFYTEALQDMGVEVFYGPYQTGLPEWLRANGADLDLVLLSRPDVAEVCLPMLRAGTPARIAYYGHDLHFARMSAHADLSRDAGQRRAAEVMQTLETGIWNGADIVLYPSEEEAAAVRALVPSAVVRSVIPYAFAESAGSDAAPERADVHVSPRGEDVMRPADTSGARTGAPAEAPWVLFVAGFGHPPNADAAVWFAREVLPSIVARVPAARLAIVGSNPSASVLALCGPHVSLFANVTDAELRAWYRRATVAVVPLLAGAGVKLKTVEALWHGVPAVLTPAGAQGLPGIERVAPVETEPARFADAVCDLLTDAALRRQRGLAGANYARERFSEAALRQSLLFALDIAEPAAVPPEQEFVPGFRANVAMA
jgi:glycosyltransferase involved in cell wall biosynthesis